MDIPAGLIAFRAENRFLHLSDIRHIFNMNMVVVFGHGIGQVSGY
jgi:hypothetical protein